MNRTFYEIDESEGLLNTPSSPESTEEDEKAAMDKNAGVVSNAVSI